jgi:hypothetical protein
MKGGLTQVNRLCSKTAPNSVLLLEPLKKFPMTVKKKEHGSYGAFFRKDVAMPTASQKIKFD